MLNLSEVVFAPTPAGYAALRNADAPMNLHLKTLLTLIDGVCPVAQYTPFLSAFEPLHEKFQILERMGYLRRAGKVSVQAVTRFEEKVAKGSPTSQFPSIDSESQESGFLALS